MKKLKTLSLIIFMISLSILCFACKETKIILSTPLSLDCVVNEGVEENKLLLVTDENHNASKYEFFISDDEGEEKVYVSYVVDTNRLDVTNIFTDKKEYSFYVRYLGTGKYLNSKNSAVKTYTPDSEQIKSPTIELNNTTLDWFKIIYANEYEIYETVLNENGEVITPSAKIATVNASTFSYDFSPRVSDKNAPYNKYSYAVKAISSGFYLSSELSNSVTYTKKITLNMPSNLNVSYTDGEYKLTWNAVDYATKYEIKINDNTTVTSETNSLIITEYLTQYSTYTFKVKAIESDVISYFESEYSNNFSYSHTTTLTTPENLSASVKGEYLDISFDAVNLAESYTLVIYSNGNEVYKTEQLTTLNFEVLISELNLSNNDIMIQVKANAVGNYIYESGFSTLNFTIPQSE